MRAELQRARKVHGGRVPVPARVHWRRLRPRVGRVPEELHGPRHLRRGARRLRVRPRVRGRRLRARRRAVPARVHELGALCAWRVPGPRPTRAHRHRPPRPPCHLLPTGARLSVAVQAGLQRARLLDGLPGTLLGPRRLPQRCVPPARPPTRHTAATLRARPHAVRPAAATCYCQEGWQGVDCSQEQGPLGLHAVLPSTYAFYPIGTAVLFTVAVLVIFFLCASRPHPHTCTRASHPARTAGAPARHRTARALAECCGAQDPCVLAQGRLPRQLVPRLARHGGDTALRVPLLKHWQLRLRLEADRVSFVVHPRDVERSGRVEVWVGESVAWSWCES